jgi:hypothetical protein
MVSSRKAVYKLGRTSQPGTARLAQYPRRSKLLYHQVCADSITCERELIRIFTVQFKRRRDYGLEYFQGSPTEMIKVIFNHLWDRMPRDLPVPLPIMETRGRSCAEPVAPAESEDDISEIGPDDAEAEEQQPRQKHETVLEFLAAVALDECIITPASLTTPTIPAESATDPDPPANTYPICMTRTHLFDAYCLFCRQTGKSPETWDSMTTILAQLFPGRASIPVNGRTIDGIVILSPGEILASLDHGSCS